MLLLLHSVLASNVLLTISRYMCRCHLMYLDILLGLHLAVTFERALSESSHRSLDHLLIFCGSEGSSNVVLSTNAAEVVCQGCHLARAQQTDVRLNLGTT